MIYWYKTLIKKGYSKYKLLSFVKTYKLNNINNIIKMHKLKMRNVKRICKNPKELYFRIIKNDIIKNNDYNDLKNMKK